MLVTIQREARPSLGAGLGRARRHAVRRLGSPAVSMNRFCVALRERDPNSPNGVLGGRAMTGIACFRPAGVDVKGSLRIAATEGCSLGKAARRLSAATAAAQAARSTRSAACTNISRVADRQSQPKRPDRFILPDRNRSPNTSTGLYRAPRSLVGLDLLVIALLNFHLRLPSVGDIGSLSAIFEDSAVAEVVERVSHFCACPAAARVRGYVWIIDHPSRCAKSRAAIAGSGDGSEQSVHRQ
jgi:hypothetical protein